MKHYILRTLLLLAPISVLFSACDEDNNVSPANNTYYSGWYSPTSWSGEAGDWYFDVTSSDINEDIVEKGIILVYMSIPNDLFSSAVRPLPAYAAKANWDYLIPEYGKIEFTCDSQTAPGTEGYYFRFVVIPSGTHLKSTKENNLGKEDLLKMSYHDVCELYGIPE
jgi:hypothetical protein